MKKNHAKDIIIDLTSLLDVVFIVLLVVICNLQTMDSAAAGKETQAREMAAEAESERDLYRQQREDISNVADYIVYISIDARYDEDFVTRHINVLEMGKDEGKKEIAELKGVNVEEGYGALRDHLKKVIDDNPDRIVVMSLNDNDEDILYRDEKRINAIIDELTGNDPQHVKKRN